MKSISTPLLAACLTFLFLGATPARSEGSLRGLLVRFDEPAGRRFTDYSGSGHTITPVGTVTRSTTDKVNGQSSVCMDGNGYLQIDPSPDFVFSEDLTIDFWFKSAHPERQHALAFGNHADSNNLDFDFVDQDPIAPTNSSVGFWLYWSGGGLNRITYHWRGCIDELRIINGRALWTSNFNPSLYLPAPLNAHR